MTAPPNDDGPQVRPFAAVLQDLDGGRLATELATELQTVLQAVSEYRLQGTLTLQLKIKPNGEDAVLITADVKPKAPRGTPPDNHFWLDADHNAVRIDPRQQQFDGLREASTDTRPARQVAGA